jgi:hypothetical protein
MNDTFIFSGKTYQVIPQENDHQPTSWYTEQIQYAIDNKQYDTVKNRIKGGLHWGWLKEIK